MQQRARACTCRSRSRRRCPSVSPSRTSKRDAVDRVHRADLLAGRRAAREREALDEVADLDRAVARSLMPGGARASGSSLGADGRARLLGRLAAPQPRHRSAPRLGASRQATWWPASSGTGSSGGSILRCAGRARRGSAGGSEQPGGGWIRRRRAAGDRHELRVARAGRAAGSSAAGPTCRGAAGAAKIVSAGACSTIRPAYMTAISSAVSATTPRSWVISTTRHPELVAQPRDQREDLRLHGHVERGRRLVGDQQPRLVRQRHRDHRALAHAARELVRVGVDAPRAARGCRPARAARPPGRAPRAARRRGARASPPRAGRRPVEGVQRRQRVLEDHRDLVAAHARAARRRRRRAGPRPRTATAPEIARCAARVRPITVRLVTLLPEPDSPTIPSVLPAVDRERDAVDRLDEAVLGVERTCRSWTRGAASVTSVVCTRGSRNA